MLAVPDILIGGHVNITMIKQDYKSGRVQVEGRTFEIEFWTETHFGLPYASVSEIKTKEVKTRLFSNKTKTKEIKCGINYGWMSSNRLDWAMRQIAEYLQRERDELEELRQIDKFCGISKGV